MIDKLSVIIPCFNGEKYLKAAIESVLTQSIKAYEIIVVDDGSTDSSKEIATSFEEVTYLHHANKGVSFSRNKGLRECSGEYVIFLDADDELPEDRIKNDCNLLDKDSELGYVFGWFNVIDEDGNPIPWANNENIVDAGHHTILAGRGTVSPGAVTFRTKCLRQKGQGFNEQIASAEDLDLYLRFSRKFPIYCHNRIALKYRKHQSNSSSANGATRTLSSILQQLKRHKKYIAGDYFLISEHSSGIKHWKKLLGPRCVGELISVLKLKDWKQFFRILIFLLKNCPNILLRTLMQKVIKNVK
jgi:glycosyltransferase involved in cell wall biosynthesis